MTSVFNPFKVTISPVSLKPELTARAPNTGCCSAPGCMEEYAACNLPPGTRT